MNSTSRSVSVSCSRRGYPNRVIVPSSPPNSSRRAVERLLPTRRGAASTTFPVAPTTDVVAVGAVEHGEQRGLHLHVVVEEHHHVARGVLDARGCAGGSARRASAT